MKKLLLFWLLFFFVSVFFCPIKAQENPHKEVISLKNGTVVRGVIVSRVPEESVTIQTDDGNFVTIRIEDAIIQPVLKSYVAEPHPVEKRKKRSTAGYYGDINFGYGLNNPKTKVNTDFFDLQIINGYQFAYCFGIGAGFGVKKDRQGVSIPIFTNFRCEFLKGRITPFASLNVGYNVKISSIHCGFYAEPKLGVAFSISERSKIMVGVSYSWNDAIYSERRGDNTFTGGGSGGGYSGGYDQFYYELAGAFRFSVGIKFQEQKINKQMI